MPHPQSLSEADRRVVATWAADCAERVLVLFETEAPTDGRPRDAIARTWAFAEVEIDAANANAVSIGRDSDVVQQHVIGFHCEYE